MLETLVSSRIRRSLLGHLLAYPSGRFYLSGLARELGLTISPLRRELKRFECVGLLKSSKEANTLFYTVDQASPAFRQLSQAWGQAHVQGKDIAASDRLSDVSGEISQGEISQFSVELPQPIGAKPENCQRTLAMPPIVTAPVPSLLPIAAQPDRQSDARAAVTPTEILRSKISQHSKRRAARPRLAFSSTTAMATLSLSLMAVVGGGVMGYLLVTHQRVVALTQAASISSPQVTMVEQGVATAMIGATQEPSMASGKMRSGHWRLSQGAVTSFSPSPDKESY